MSKLDLGLERSLVFNSENGRLVASDRGGEQDVLAMPMEAFFGLVDDLFEMFQSGASVILEKAGRGAGMAPEYILFDSWYSSMENLKIIAKLNLPSEVRH